MMSTPSASSARASVSFAGTSIEKPGACSPSRSVVSKTTMRAGSWLMASVVAVRRGRSQSDNYYVIITIVYGPDRAADLSRRRRGAQLFARGGQGAPHPAGRQPGGPPARSRSRRAAVRPVVEDRHADRCRADAAELRAAAGPAGRRNRVGDARAARPAARPRADRRQRSGRAHAAAADRALPPARTRHRHRRAPRAGAADCGRGAAGQPRFRRAHVSPARRPGCSKWSVGSDELVLLVPPTHRARQAAAGVDGGRGGGAGRRAQRSVAGARARAAAVRGAPHRR